MPIVVFEQEARRQRIVARNQNAARSGVNLHRSPAEANALCDQLIALPREPLREMALLIRLATAVGCLTPNIHLGESYGLLLDVSASLMLFGGAHALVNRVNALLEAQRIRAHVVLAPSARGARWLARAHRQLIVTDDLPDWLDDLGFDNTDFPSTLIDELKAINLHSLADLRKLPTRDLGLRFGATLGQQLAQAYGETTETLSYWQPAARFHEKVEFLDLAVEVNNWMPGIEALLQQLQEFLYRRASSTTTISFLFQQGSQRQTLLDLNAAQGIHSAKDWLRLFNAQIERHPVLHEISRIDLLCKRMAPMLFSEMDFFDRSSEREREWKSLYGLLKTRLGDSALLAPRNNASALPEMTAAVQQVTHPHGVRPVWLIDPPRQLSEREMASLAPSLAPEHPERIAENWSHAGGQSQVLRDYYVARTADHKALWVFRDKPSNRWFLQGLFC